MSKKSFVSSEPHFTPLYHFSAHLNLVIGSVGVKSERTKETVALSMKNVFLQEEEREGSIYLNSFIFISIEKSS